MLQEKWRGIFFGAWGFAVAAAFLPGIYSAPFLPRWWVLALGFAFVPRLDLRLVDEKILWCMGVTLLWAALTLMWTPALYGGAFLLFFLLLFCLLTVASASATANERGFALSGFAAALLVSAVIAFAQRFFDYHGVAQGVPGLPAGLFFNTEVLAETAAPIAVWCALQWRDPVYLITSAILIALVIVCRERVAMAVLLIGLAYGFIANPKWRIGVLGLIGIAGFVTLFLKIASADQRILLWSTAAISITAAGRGIGWWFQAHPFPQEEYVHSDALQFLVEIGIFALPLLAVPVLAWRGAGNVADRAAFLAVAIEGVVSFPLHMPANVFIFGILAGALAARRGDIRVPRLSGRETDDDGLGRQGASGGVLHINGQRSLGVVSLRSAHAQHADMGFADGRGRTGTGAAIAAASA